MRQRGCRERGAEKPRVDSRGRHERLRWRERREDAEIRREVYAHDVGRKRLLEHREDLLHLLHGARRVADGEDEKRALEVVVRKAQPQLVDEPPRAQAEGCRRRLWLHACSWERTRW